MFSHWCKSLVFVTFDHTHTELLTFPFSSQKQKAESDDPDQVSSAESEKSQEMSEPATVTTEIVKKPENNADTIGPYEPDVPVGETSFKSFYRISTYRWGRIISFFKCRWFLNAVLSCICDEIILYLQVLSL